MPKSNCGNTTLNKPPGKAEAELAYLNRTGVIDVVLSDDVDNFLFGTTTVICKWVYTSLAIPDSQLIFHGKVQVKPSQETEHT